MDGLCGVASYITNAAAQTDIDTKLKNILGAGEYSIATQKKNALLLKSRVLKN